MTGYKKVFLDTAPFIYFIEKNEKNPLYFDKVKKFLMESYDNDVDMETSVITVEEYMVFPYRNSEQKYINLFKKLLKELEINIIDIDREIAEKAARIRAEYKAFKAMDALQLAAACAVGCDLFLTNDKQLR
ncbi:MAG: PIN domain-containing protein, partial [Lachnospiraceae bacterium]|nr:PIN domain-containing protein [Lachnospiraceae bacterium]